MAGETNLRLEKLETASATLIERADNLGGDLRQVDEKYSKLSDLLREMDNRLVSLKSMFEALFVRFDQHEGSLKELASSVAGVKERLARIETKLELLEKRRDDGLNRIWTVCIALASVIAGGLATRLLDYLFLIRR